MADEFLKIEVTELEMSYFVAFQKNYRNFKKLVDDGVFDIKTGKAVLNFKDGEIKTIERRFFS